MKFTINDILFSDIINMDNNISIKSLNKNYEVIYNQKNLNEIIDEYYEKNDFIIIDKNVYNLNNSILNIDSKYFFIFDANEDNKNIDSVMKIIDILINVKFSKKNKIIIIGGGISQDVGGFLSAIYKRGVKWVLIPTTLLSMTDSCIGSKVGINRISKNMVGLFYSPDKIIVSDKFLNTLSSDDIISGIGEALKLSLIGGNETYKYFIENYNNLNFINLIKMSISVKKIIIEYDEFENNERKVLNYGHTFGHALEYASNYFIPHGIAVIFGMYIINNLFYPDKYNELNEFMIKMIPTKFKNIKIPYEIFLNSILNDKKNDNDNICFILLDDIGKTKIIFEKLDNINDNLKNILNSLFEIL